jgi:hypothetical protein
MFFKGKIDINKKFVDYKFDYPHVSISNMIMDILNRYEVDDIDIYEGFYRFVISFGNIEIKIKGSPQFEIRITKDFNTYRGGETLYLENNIKDFVRVLSKYYPLAAKTFKKINDFPFDEEKVSENEVIRTFKQDTDSEEFVWHRDREDRIVEVIGETDWRVQLDNEIPQKLQKVFIPKNIYHRVIKGTGDLKVKIKKLK